MLCMHATVRVSSKKNRSKQELVSTLYSYSVPIPKKVMMVFYDTGIEKRGFRDTRMPKYFRRPQVSAERTWRRETVTVGGKPQVRHRDLITGRFIKKP
jgi:hypothetical protein